jgi:hypothetical protein
VFANPLGEHLAPLGGNLLRIVEPDDAPLRIENNCCGYDGAEERSAADFVEPGDARPAQLSRFSLVPRRAKARHL